MEFKQAFDTALFRENRVLVDEDLSQNCDFFILELVGALRYTVFQANDSGELLMSAMSKRNLLTKVGSAYASAYDGEDIIDDVATLRRLGQTLVAKVNIFRSSTATVRDYYDYDLVVKIGGLKSGWSKKIDGTIKVFKRDTVYRNLKYKVHPSRIEYFE